MHTLFVATGNAHKVAEIRAGLGEEFTYLSQRDVGIRLEPIEDGASFAANAAIKAVTWAAQFSQLGASVVPHFVLADDSGLEVDALGGAPGIHSARYAALEGGRPGNSPDSENNARLLRELAAFPGGPWTARFRCVLALTPVARGTEWADLHRQTRWFEGTCEGSIRPVAAGAGGFGYDPLFVPEGENQSFAELGEAHKNRISHRARALRSLRASWLPDLSDPTGEPPRDRSPE